MAATVELAWWESATPAGIGQFVLEIDERDLMKLEQAVLNAGAEQGQGMFRVKLLHQEVV